VTSNAIFEMTVPVLPTDIDEQNHVNNTVYLRWIQDVATAHWKSLAGVEAQAAIGWIVLRHEIDYRSPAGFDDEILLRTWVGQASRLKFERFTEIHRKACPERSRKIDMQLLAQARTLWVPIDVHTGKPTRVSSELRLQFSTS
jgi:acyl-CoA thioester hydrolase